MPLAATLITSASFILGAYLLGSISFAVLISKLMGLQDPRSFGSGNPGATNVLRTGNKTAAILTLLGDSAKGLVAVLLAQSLAPGMGLGTTTVAMCGLAAFLGHVFPVFLKFKGGKGVATALGVILGLNPWLALATLATWLIVAFAFKYSSLAAIVAAIFAPLYYLLGSNVAWRLDTGTGVALAVIALVLIYRHRANIERLISGKEPRIGQGKKKKKA